MFDMVYFFIGETPTGFPSGYTPAYNTLRVIPLFPIN